jgi:hypothetical protein
MRELLLTGKADKHGSEELVIVSGLAPTGYKLLEGAHWGNAVWENIESGQRGTQGARSAGAIPSNRMVALPFLIEGAERAGVEAHDDMEAKWSRLALLADELRQYGGRLTWRPRGGTYLQYFDVLSAQARIDDFGRLYHHNHRAGAVFEALCAPYLSGPSMDVFDDFSTDTIEDYTFDSGGGTLAVSGGKLVPSTTGLKAFFHSKTGYTYGDAEVTLRVRTGASGTGTIAIVLRRVDASNYLLLTWTSGALSITKVVAGVSTSLTTAGGAPATTANTDYWLRFRSEGNRVFGELFSAPPTPMAVPLWWSNHTMSATTAGQLGRHVEGQAGLRITAPVDWRYDDFTIDAYTYRGPNDTGTSLPAEYELSGEIPGDAPAVAELEVTTNGGAEAPVWALCGWWERPQPASYVWNGDFATLLAGMGWDDTAVTNITAGNADGVVPIADPLFPSGWAGQITTTAAVDRGSSFAMYRKFKAGVTYRFEVGVRHPTLTTSVYARIGYGAGSDTAQSANTPLSAAVQTLVVDWTPTADTVQAHVAVNVATATALTFRIGSVKVYELANPPASSGQLDGRGGIPPVGVIELENGAPNSNPQSSASFRGGKAHDAAADPSLVIDPAVLVADPYTQAEIAIEFWARVRIIDPSQASITLEAAALSSTLTSVRRYTIEFGSEGRDIPLPSAATVFRFTRLGTIIFPTRLGRWLLIVKPGGFVDAIDYLVAVPSNQRVVSPTGKPQDEHYPVFIPATSQVTKRVRSDLSATITEPAAPEVESSGLGGSLLELPPGLVDAVVKLSSTVPDDPLPTTRSDQLAHTGVVHFSVTPRWHLARS